MASLYDQRRMVDRADEHFEQLVADDRSGLSDKGSPNLTLQRGSVTPRLTERSATLPARPRTSPGQPRLYARIRRAPHWCGEDSHRHRALREVEVGLWIFRFELYRFLELQLGIVLQIALSK